MGFLEQMFEDTGLKKSPSQARIHLDRYTVKDLKLESLKVGSVVIATVEPGKYPVKDYGFVTAIEGHEVVFDGVIGQKEYRVHKRHVSVPIDWKFKDTVERWVAGSVAIEEKLGFKAEKSYRDALREAFINERFVPGGRIQSTMGAKEYTGQDLSLTPYNCFVLPSPRDSREGIIDLLKETVNILSRGGGVGINQSTLRPRYSKVYGVNGTSSGAVSWAGLFSDATGLVEQGGSRRGALMTMLHITHPDIKEFIHAKVQKGAFENSNLSVQITHEFMEAVELDQDWHLIFPVTEHPEYDLRWGEDYKSIHDWLAAGLPVEIYETVKARDLFKEIVRLAWESAEPGFAVYDRMNRRQFPTQQLAKQADGTYVSALTKEQWEQTVSESPWNNTFYWQENIATNPCGEQPLPAWGVCNLGHINLAEFYDSNTNDVNWHLLSKTIQTAVRFLDDVIDYAYYFDERNRTTQMNQRRIGLGTMGLANLLFSMQLRYGSDEAVDFVDKLYRFIANEAYKASALLAKERGSFPMYSEKLLEARLPRLLDKETRDLIKEYGLRNSHLLTQAPTGTTGTKTGRYGYSVSTGIEPYFALEWERKSRVGPMTENIVDHYMERHGLEEVPPYFVSAMCVEDDGVTPKITPLQHVKMQAAIQKWNDSAISKTTNVPAHFKVEQTEELYMEAYKRGLVGITIYRDGSRHEQILSVKQEPKDATSVDVLQQETSNTTFQQGRVFRHRPDRLVGETFKKPTPLGNALITVNSHEGEPVEIVLNVGKGGSHTHTMSEALGRLASLFLQYVKDTSERKLHTLIRQLSDIGGVDAVGFGPNRINSVPDAVAKVLQQILDERTEGEQATMTFEEVASPTQTVPIRGDICPNCGQAGLIKVDGCMQCVHCLESRC